MSALHGLFCFDEEKMFPITVIGLEKKLIEERKLDEKNTIQTGAKLPCAVFFIMRCFLAMHAKNRGEMHILIHL